MDTASMVAIRINDLLGRYIEVHDEIFGFSFRKILPIPGIFKPIDFASRRDQLRAIHGEMELALRNLQSSRSSAGEPSSHPFLQALENYARTLLDTVHQLAAICHQLYLNLNPA